MLLDFQLAGHRGYLKPLVQAYRQLDPHNAGVVDEAGFRSLLGALAPNRSEAEVTSLLVRLDPHSHEQITFSDCVSALSGDLGAAGPE